MSTTASPNPSRGSAARAAAPRQKGLVRLAATLLIGTAGWAIPFSGTSGVLLPAKIEDLAPDDKILWLAVITSVGAIVGLAANIIFGALSDLTRTRIGARNPWIIGGAIVTSGFLVMLSTADSFGTILLWWCLAQAALNAIVASIAAFIPDRVSVQRRATLS